MLELYNFAQSTCSLKVRLAMHEKGIAWVDRVLVSKNQDHLSDWYLKLNPNGVVPTLIHNGTPVIESSVIVQYLDEIYPPVSLTPPTPLARAEMRAFLAFVDAVPTPAVRFPSFQYGGLIRKFLAMTDAEFAESVALRPLKGEFYKRMGRTGFPREDIDKALADIVKTAGRMDLLLEKNGGPFLMGEQLTLADVAVAPLIDRMEDLGFAYLWESRYPRVATWLADLQARPAYAQAYYPGSRLSDQFPDLGLGRGTDARQRQPELAAAAE